MQTFKLSCIRKHFSSFNLFTVHLLIRKIIFFTPQVLVAAGPGRSVSRGLIYEHRGKETHTFGRLLFILTTFFIIFYHIYFFKRRSAGGTRGCQPAAGARRCDAGKAPGPAGPGRGAMGAAGVPRFPRGKGRGRGGSAGPGLA